MACRPYNTGRCLLLRLFNCPNFGVHFKNRPQISFNSSLMSTIQYIDKERRELLEDLREIACSYQPLKETDPQKYRRTVLREMNDYLHRIKQHPVFSEFCELTHINQDEFMNDIIQQITDEWL